MSLEAFKLAQLDNGLYYVIGPGFSSGWIDQKSAQLLVAQLNYAHSLGVHAPTPEDIARMREAAGFAHEEVAALKAKFFAQYPAIKAWYDLLQTQAVVEQRPLKPVTKLTRIEMVHQLVRETHALSARLFPEVRQPINRLIDAVELLAAECEALRATCNARVRE